MRAALLELCEERGHAGLTAAEIRRRAGISEAEFGALYEDAEDAFCTVLEAMRDEFVAAVAAAVAPQPSWRAQMRAAAYAMLEFWVADPPRARYMLVEAFSAGERASLIRDQGMEAMIALVDVGRRDPEAPASLTRATAEALAGTIYTQMQRIVIEERGPEEYRQIVPELMHTLVLPYLGPEIAAEELATEGPPPPPAGADT